MKPSIDLLNVLHKKVEDILDGFSGDGDEVQEAAADGVGVPWLKKAFDGN